VFKNQSGTVDKTESNRHSANERVAGSGKPEFIEIRNWKFKVY
jgi:hypothetical protein